MRTLATGCTTDTNNEQSHSQKLIIKRIFDQIGMLTALSENHGTVLMELTLVVTEFASSFHFILHYPHITLI